MIRLDHKDKPRKEICDMTNLTDNDRKQYIEVLLALKGYNNNRKDDEASKDLPKNLTKNPPNAVMARVLATSK